MIKVGQNLFLVALAMVTMRCASEQPNDCASQLEAIAKLEQQLFGDEEMVQDDVRSQLMKCYGEFANQCHDAAETPEMLFRRADLLRSAGRFQEAMTQLRDVHDHYPEFEKRAISAFLVGFIAEVELNDREQAKKTYEQVIELHPESDAAEWARFSIESLNQANN